MIEFDYSEIDRITPPIVVDQERALRNWLHKNGVEDATVVVSVIDNSWHFNINLNEKDAPIVTMLSLSGENII